MLEVWPENDSVDLPTDLSVSVVFSRDLQARTIDSSSFRLQLATGESVPGLVVASGRRARFIPKSELSWDSEYVVTLTDEIRDVDGNRFEEHRSQFRTVDPDRLELEIVQALPRPGQRRVPMGTDVRVLFNRELAADQPTADPIRLDGPSGPVRGQVVVVGKSLQFLLEEEVESESWMRVLVSGDVVDSGGTTLETDHAWRFRFEDNVSPCVEEVFPVAGSVVTSEVKISARFSEELEPSSLRPDAIFLRDLGRQATVEVDVVYEPESSTAALIPRAGSLTSGTIYEAVLTQSISDDFGNPLCEEHRWRFRTIDGSGGTAQLFVCSEFDRQGTISVFRVPASGFPEQIPGSPYSSEGVTRDHAHIDSAVLSPDGRFLHCLNEWDRAIVSFRVLPLGELAQLPSSPIQLQCAPLSLAMHPNGKWLYVSRGNGTCGGAIEILRVLENGALEKDRVVETRIFEAQEMVIDGTGRRLVASFTNRYQIEFFSIDPSGGLTQTAFLKNNDLWSPASMAMTSTGEFLYFSEYGTDGGSEGVLGFRIDQSGQPTELEDSPFHDSSVSPARCVRLGPNDRFLFLSSSIDIISVFEVLSNGALKAVPGSPFRVTDTGTWYPRSLGVHPRGDFLYVTSRRYDPKDLTLTTLAISPSGQLTRIGDPMQLGDLGSSGTLLVRPTLR